MTKKKRVEEIADPAPPLGYAGINTGVALAGYAGDAMALPG